MFGLGDNTKTTVDRFGRILLPKKLRDDFELEPGSKIHIEESGQEIILKPIHEEPNSQLKEDVLVFLGVPLGDLYNAVTINRERRIKSFQK